MKQSRLVKRRTLAKELCEEGAVVVNGVPARPGREVTPGDRLGVRLWNRLLEIEVKGIPERAVSAAEARESYWIVSERRVEPIDSTEEDEER